jgi:hypothetical protein
MGSEGSDCIYWYLYVLTLRTMDPSLIQTVGSDGSVHTSSHTALDETTREKLYYEQRTKQGMYITYQRQRNIQ